MSACVIIVGVIRVLGFCYLAVNGYPGWGLLMLIFTGMSFTSNE